MKAPAKMHLKMSAECSSSIVNYICDLYLKDHNYNAFKFYGLCVKYTNFDHGRILQKIPPHQGPGGGGGVGGYSDISIHA